MLAYYLLINGVTFAIWGVDKYQAIQHNWRVPERWLYTLNILGGSFGALAGMSAFRHKTRKPHFWVLGILCSIIHALFIMNFLTVR